MPDAFNATRITERLIVGGGLVGPNEVEWLAQQDVTAIISAAAELDDALFVNQSGEKAVTTLHIPWEDNGQSKPADDFWRAYHFVEEQAYQQLGSGKVGAVYVHCAAGCNRGPLMATYLLALWSGLSADTAWDLVHGMRPITTAFTIPAYRQSCLDALAPRRSLMPPTDVPQVTITEVIGAQDEANVAAADEAANASKRAK